MLNRVYTPYNSLACAVCVSACCRSYSSNIYSILMK